MSTKEFVELQKSNLKLQEHVIRQYSEYKDELNALQKENHELKKLLQLEKQKGAEIFQQFSERIHKMEQDLEEINYSPPVSPQNYVTTNTRPLSRSRQLFEQLEEEGKKLEEETRRVFEFCRKPVEFYIPPTAPAPPPPTQTIPQQTYQFIPIQVPQYTTIPKPSPNPPSSISSPVPTSPKTSSTSNTPQFVPNVNGFNQEIEQLQQSPIGSPRGNSPSNKQKKPMTPNDSQIPSVDSPPANQSNNKISDVNFGPSSDSEEDDDDIGTLVTQNQEIPSSAFDKMNIDPKKNSAAVTGSSDTRAASDSKPASETLPIQPVKTAPKVPKESPPPSVKPIDPLGGFGSEEESELDIEFPSAGFDDGNANNDLW